MNVRRMNTVRLAGTSLVATAVLLTGCGGEVPTRSEFVSKMRGSLDDQLSSMEESGISKDRAREIFDEFVGCTYDKIKGDAELLKKVFEEGDDAGVDDQLSKEAADCSDQLTSALSEAMQASSTGG